MPINVPLAHALKSAQLPRIMTCMSFIGAHLASQKLLIKYFGGNGKIDSEDEVLAGDKHTARSQRLPPSATPEIKGY